MNLTLYKLQHFIGQRELIYNYLKSADRATMTNDGHKALSDRHYKVLCPYVVCVIERSQASL